MIRLGTLGGLKPADYLCQARRIWHVACTTAGMLHRHTPRIEDFNYRGTHRYSWTLCTYRRRAVFRAPDVVEAVRVQFLHASRSNGVAVLAYCFMPDHVHLLIEGERAESCATDFVSCAKQASGYWFKRQTGQRLWQRTSWDRVLRREDNTWTVIRYILANPVRAGLVQRSLDYPFSGSFVYERDQLMEAFLEQPAG